MHATKFRSLLSTAPAMSGSQQLRTPKKKKAAVANIAPVPSSPAAGTPTKPTASPVGFTLVVKDVTGQVAAPIATMLRPSARAISSHLLR